MVPVPRQTRQRRSRPVQVLRAPSPLQRVHLTRRMPMGEVSCLSGVGEAADGPGDEAVDGEQDGGLAEVEAEGAEADRFPAAYVAGADEEDGDDPEDHRERERRTITDHLLSPSSATKARSIAGRSGVMPECFRAVATASSVGVRWERARAQPPSGPVHTATPRS